MMEVAEAGRVSKMRTPYQPKLGAYPHAQTVGVPLTHHRSLFEDSDDDASSSDTDENEGEDAPLTASNFAARSRALDARAAREAQLDAEELQHAAQVEADEFDGVEDMDDDEDEDDAPGAEGFSLPTIEERTEEKKSGGPEVHVVQKRMRECVRILKRWKASGARTGRFVITFILGVFFGDGWTGLALSLSNRSYQISLAITDITIFWPKSYSSFSLWQRHVD
jgi:hypothetical protein